jgi:hypothetical protein
MALCPQCSSPPITGDLFCRKCGTALVPSAPVVRPPSLQTSRANRPRKLDMTGLVKSTISSVLAVTLSILAVICLTLFFYIRSLATVPSVTSVLEGGRSSYLDHGTALFLELVTIILFGLFIALAIPAVVRTVRSPTHRPVVATVRNEGEPLVARRLRDLASLRSQGLLSADEYETKRAEILANV